MVITSELAIALFLGGLRYHSDQDLLYLFFTDGQFDRGPFHFINCRLENSVDVASENDFSINIRY